MTLEQSTLFEALAQHDIRVAHGQVEPGTEFILAGESAPEGKYLAIYGGDRPRYALPIGDEGARALTDGVLAFHHRLAPHVRLMLEHLFMRVADVFGAPELTDLRLTVRIHGDGYTVVHAQAEATRPLVFAHRPSRRMRAGNARGYRPSGRQ